jgi:hypothetical protein
VAYNNTIDEPVWATLRRDLLAIWGKLREVLWPKYLFGGTMFEPGLRGVYAGLRGGQNGEQGEGGASLLGNARDELGTLAGRVMDPEALLSANNMSPSLRDWDLWGPLLFSLLLSVLLTLNRSTQKDAVFSGVFAMIWIGEAVVTLQIKLLGGNMWVFSPSSALKTSPRLRLLGSLSYPTLADPTSLQSAPSLKASASSATPSSRSSLRPSCRPSICRPFLAYQSTSS